MQCSIQLFTVMVLVICSLTCFVHSVYCTCDKRTILTSNRYDTYDQYIQRCVKGVEVRVCAFAPLLCVFFRVQWRLHFLYVRLISLQIGLSLTLCGCHVFFVVNKVESRGKNRSLPKTSTQNLISFYYYSVIFGLIFIETVKYISQSNRKDSFIFALVLLSVCVCDSNIISRQQSSACEFQCIFFCESHKQ